VETLVAASALARFGYALSDPTRARVLVELSNAPAYSGELAELLGVSRQSMSNHLACLRDCGLVVTVPEGRRARYELADFRLAHALKDLLGVVLVPAPGHLAADKHPTAKHPTDEHPTDEHPTDKHPSV
jgi:DNA-binding transcriptional ArsR family regulator